MFRILYLLLGIVSTDAFASLKTTSGLVCLQAAKENKAMEFLRKIGRVGTNQDFTNAIGVDEGPSGKSKGVCSLYRRVVKLTHFLGEVEESQCGCPTMCGDWNH